MQVAIGPKVSYSMCRQALEVRLSNFKCCQCVQNVATSSQRARGSVDGAAGILATSSSQSPREFIGFAASREDANSREREDSSIRAGCDVVPSLMASVGQSIEGQTLDSGATSVFGRELELSSRSCPAGSFRFSIRS